MKAFRFAAFITMIGVFVVGCAGSQSTQQPRQEENTSQWINLFNGDNLDGWTMAGPGSFEVQEDQSMLTQGGMGLLYYSDRAFEDFVLEFDWKAATDSANSGVFLRFPEKTDDPWYAVENGYEIQIDGSSDVDPVNSTGAVYDISAPFRNTASPAGEWNHYRIKVTGQRYEIFINGEKVNDFFGDRGRQGYIGFQNHDPDSKVRFRNVRVKPLPDTGAPERLADLFDAPAGADPIQVLMVTATNGFRHGPAIEAAKSVMKELEETTEFQFDITEDLSALNAENLEKYDLLFFNNATLRMESALEEQAANTTGEVWSLSLETEQGAMNGELVLGEAGEEGTISFEANSGTSELQNVEREGSTLSFTFDGGQYGEIPGEITLEGDQLEGDLTVEGNEMTLTGSRNEASASTASESGLSEDQLQAVLNFVRDGKGFIGTHAAADALYESEEYRELLGGGLFEAHPWTQSVGIKVEDEGNPAVSHFDDTFYIRDEIYVLDENPRWNSDVMASLDMNSVGVIQGPADATRNDYPVAWMRTYGDGKVFYTKLGHFPDVWRTPGYLTHLLQGMRATAGRVQADFSGHRVKEVIAEGVWPDDIAVDEQGDVWIAELRGKVHHYDSETGETNQIAIIPTTDPTKIEHGLYGIEVDPNFYEGEPYVYAFYAERNTFINTLARFTYRDGELDLSSKEVLLRVPTEPQCCHQAGDLEWGPEGKLFISTGDTGMSETRPTWELTEEEIQDFMDRYDLKDYHWSRLVDSERSSQNLQDLRGKVLRINKDGSIPKDNPFYGEPGARWEVYAYGFRNPYRIKVDPKTGDVHVGVVGPDAAYDYDEYNIVTEGGQNFGWPRGLGRLFFNEWTADQIPDHVPSAWEYTYQTGGRSASAGPIYRHSGPGGFPEIFQGKVFIYDWARRWIKWADVETLAFTNDTTSSVKAWDYQVSIPTNRYVDIKTFDVLTDTTPISMELGPDGAIYVAEFTGFWGPAPGARVTRYRWVEDDEAQAGTASRATPSTEGVSEAK